jgi:hypothetical protein
MTKQKLIPKSKASLKQISDAVRILGVGGFNAVQFLIIENRKVIGGQMPARYSRSLSRMERVQQ